MISCRKIDEKYYINSDINYECFTESHLKSMLFISIPGLLSWIIIIPFLLLIKIKKGMTHLNDAGFN